MRKRSDSDNGSEKINKRKAKDSPRNSSTKHYDVPYSKKEVKRLEDGLASLCADDELGKRLTKGDVSKAPRIAMAKPINKPGKHTRNTIGCKPI